ncbi:MAG: carbohydrate kinase family protein [Gemmatimonadota bacterium]|nr:MAG: carbohydrate kinase family protein [Gemmatimonadota bacterium]
MQGRVRILGVIGTMVWDTIWREHDVRSPIEEWGGISYALAAADAAAHSGFQVRPIIKLGRDLAERGLRFIRELGVIESDIAVTLVDQPNPRVELRYSGSARRSERLRGATPTWAWSDLQTRIKGCDALYVNFITGSELDLECAKELRRGFDGPIYGDMHSLMLATGPRGERSHRPLERWAEWLGCFDAVQVNEDELAVLSSHWGDPWAFAADVVGRGPRLLFVTLGARGAAYFMAESALPLERSLASQVIEGSRVRTGRVMVEPMPQGDPTGCGDVWGVSVFGALLAGLGVEEAMRLANEAARRNVAHRGASGLNRFLRGEIELG